MDMATLALIGKIAETGVLVAFELLVIIGLVYAYRALSKRQNDLVDSMFGAHKLTLDVVTKNTEVLSKLAEKIDAKKH